jgi:hypothetical protein
MTVDIDHDVLTDAKIKEWNDFWGDAEDRARRTGGALPGLLEMTLMIALRESVTSFSGIASLLKGDEEGFPRMDGSEGITIVEFHDFEFDEYDIDVREEVLE